jgi:hypothetical protein
VNDPEKDGKLARPNLRTCNRPWSLMLDIEEEKGEEVNKKRVKKKPESQTSRGKQREVKYGRK